MANPKRMNTRANITYSGLFVRESSRCRATISPNPIVVNVMKQLEKFKVFMLKNVSCVLEKGQKADNKTH